MIDSLTSDEDTQQDMWVAFLTHGYRNNFNKILKNNKIQSLIEQSNNLGGVLTLSIPQKILNKLSDLQRQTLLLYLLGYSVYDISQYNYIHEDRAVEEIDNIKRVFKNHGFKEKIFR